MKTRVLSLAALAAVATSTLPSVGFAQEQGRVISSTPVVQQVAVPRQVCANEVVQTTGVARSGAGAAVGAIAGGAIANTMGQGAGRAAATVIGVLGGAVLGDKIEGGTPVAQAQNMQRCSTQSFYENKAVAYNVVYEFNGKQYQVQMPQDPGPFVTLSVTPVGAVSAAPAPAQAIAAPVVQPSNVIVPATTVIAPPPVITSSVVYSSPVVYPAPVVYPVISPAVVVRPYVGYPHHGHHYRGGAVVNIGYRGRWH